MSNPQSLNRYAFVLNNPLRFSDPFGLMYCKITYGKGGAKSSECVSDDEYEKNKKKYEGYEKGVHVENVTVSANGDYKKMDPFLARLYFTWGGYSRRLRPGGGLLNSQAYINAISKSFEAFPTVTGGGVFGYAGYEVELPICR
jgi:hypothetical protein